MLTLFPYTTLFRSPDEVATNRLTIDASDPKSGTAEFKACAVRVRPAEAPAMAAAASVTGAGSD